MLGAVGGVVAVAVLYSSRSEPSAASTPSQGTEPSPALASAFRLPRHFQGVDHYLDSPEFNSGSAVLSSEERDELSGLIKEATLRERDLRNRIAVEAESWAGLRIDNGDFRYLIGDEEVRLSDGSITVSRSYLDGSEKVVKIFPDECASLDLLVSDLVRLIAETELRIRQFINIHSSQ